MNQIFCVLIFFAILSSGQAKLPVEPKKELRLQWVGGPTVRLMLSRFNFLTDPMLSLTGDTAFVMPKHPSTGQVDAPIYRISPLPDVSLASLDAVLLSHIHADHFDKGAKKKLDKNTLIIAPPNAREQLLADGFQRLIILDWNEHFELQKDGERIRISTVKAFHAHDPALNTALGQVNGYIIQLTDGAQTYTIYWTGDTVWKEELAEIKSTWPSIDLLLPHLGAVGKGSSQGLRTLDAEEAMRLVDVMQAKVVVPIHHTTFTHYAEPVKAFTHMPRRNKGTSILKVLAEGEIIDLHTLQVNGSQTR